ncbi:MAG: hypothetical protein ACTSUE_18785 [Promethearchaeota archaeon]
MSEKKKSSSGSSGSSSSSSRRRSRPKSKRELDEPLLNKKTRYNPRDDPNYGVLNRMNEMERELHTRVLGEYLNPDKSPTPFRQKAVAIIIAPWIIYTVVWVVALWVADFWWLSWFDATVIGLICGPYVLFGLLASIDPVRWLYSFGNPPIVTAKTVSKLLPGASKDRVELELKVAEHVNNTELGAKFGSTEDLGYNHVSDMRCCSIILFVLMGLMGILPVKFVLEGNPGPGSPCNASSCTEEFKTGFNRSAVFRPVAFFNQKSWFPAQQQYVDWASVGTSPYDDSTCLDNLPQGDARHCEDFAVTCVYADTLTGSSKTECSWADSNGDDIQGFYATDCGLLENPFCDPLSPDTGSPCKNQEDVECDQLATENLAHYPNPGVGIPNDFDFVATDDGHQLPHGQKVTDQARCPGNHPLPVPGGGTGLGIPVCPLCLGRLREHIKNNKEMYPGYIEDPMLTTYCPYSIYWDENDNLKAGSGMCAFMCPGFRYPSVSSWVWYKGARPESISLDHGIQKVVVYVILMILPLLIWIIQSCIERGVRRPLTPFEKETIVAEFFSEDGKGWRGVKHKMGHKIADMQNYRKNPNTLEKYTQYPTP